MSLMKGIRSLQGLPYLATIECDGTAVTENVCSRCWIGSTLNQLFRGNLNAFWGAKKTLQERA